MKTISITETVGIKIIHDKLLFLQPIFTMMEKKELQDKKLNEQESLELITRMIQNTQHRLEHDAGIPMLIWGYATIFSTLLVWLTLKYTEDPRMQFLWFLIPLIGGVGTLLQKKKAKKGVRTYVDKVVGHIWLVMGLTGFLLSCLSIFSVMWKLPILFLIILIMGMGTILTGLVTEYKPMVIAGIAALLIGVANYLLPGFDMKMLTFILAFVVMGIIPGHILNHRARYSHV